MGGGIKLVESGTPTLDASYIVSGFVGSITCKSRLEVSKKAFDTLEEMQRAEQIKAYESTPNYKAYVKQEEAKIKAFRTSPENTCPKTAILVTSD